MKKLIREVDRLFDRHPLPFIAAFWALAIAVGWVAGYYAFHGLPNEPWTKKDALFAIILWAIFFRQGRGK